MTNVEIVQAYYDSFNKKQWQQMLGFLDENVIHGINQGDAQKGKKVFESFLGDMDKWYDENLTHMVVMGSEKNPDRVAAEFVCNGTYKSSSPGLPEAKGQKYSLPVGAFFEVRNGKICRITNYYNLQDWLDQVSK